jgi:hypothetical protein
MNPRSDPCAQKQDIDRAMSKACRMHRKVLRVLGLPPDANTMVSVSQFLACGGITVEDLGMGIVEILILNDAQKWELETNGRTEERGAKHRGRSACGSTIPDIDKLLPGLPTDTSIIRLEELPLCMEPSRKLVDLSYSRNGGDFGEPVCCASITSRGHTVSVIRCAETWGFFDPLKGSLECGLDEFEMMSRVRAGIGFGHGHPPADVTLFILSPDDDD